MTVIETIYSQQSEARERVYIFTDSAFMKEAANSLLKVFGGASGLRYDFLALGEY